ncbi:MAG: thioester domain-containing protein [Mycobacterium sp.]
MPSLSLLSTLAPAPERVRVDRRIQPTPSVDLSRMTRYRGGTYSHTVDTIVFADGSSARTDLIRLNPNIEAYSLDFTGVAPTRPSRYAADTWAAVPHLQARAHEAEVDWILRNSYPTLSTTTLSARLRAAGYPLGGRNIAEHEAIAGTQAAIWYLSNGLELDTRAHNVPTRVSKDATGVTVEFDGERQLAGYTATVSTAGGATLSLQKSADGQEWEDVAASMVTVGPGGGEVTRSLGVGSTVSHSRFGRHGGGHSHYRLLVSGGEILGEVSFRLHGAPLFSNAEPIVYLYRYLLAGARAARESVVTPSLVATDAVVDRAVVGPFRLEATASAALEVSAGSLLHRNGNPVDAPLQPGAEFFIRPVPGSRGVTVTAKVPGDADGFGGRVITGVARDELDGRYTPLALAVPAQLVVEFDIDWAASV